MEQDKAKGKDSFADEHISTRELKNTVIGVFRRLKNQASFKHQNLTLLNYLINIILLDNG